MIPRFLSFKIHPEGWRFVLIFTAITLLLFGFSCFFGWIGIILTGWCAYFFRNPVRVTPLQAGILVSPADGTVCHIKEMLPPEELDMGNVKRWRVSIFLNVFDVHVNRIPMGGRIVKSLYEPGKFINAASEDASNHNERQTLVIEVTEGQKVAVVQIAGLIARRILCEVKVNDMVQSGQVYGLIRFGSRMDIYLPEGISPRVILGQRMVAGETIIANLLEPSSIGEGVSH